jgi:hypothetical protein
MSLTKTTMKIENISISRLNVSRIRSNILSVSRIGPASSSTDYITDDLGSVLTDDSGQKITT